MNQSKFLKIFAFVAFVVLMVISCWATVESLRLSLSWPLVFIWGLAVIIFVLWSIGTKLIVDSFNQRIRVENRGLRLIGGIILLCVWIVFGITTNAHTLFYRATVKEVLNTELSFVKGKLSDLNNGGEAKKMIEQEKADFTNKVNVGFEKVHSEIMDSNNSGYGPRAKEAIRNLANILGDGVEFQEPKFVDSHQGRLNCSDNLRKQKDKFLESKLNTVYNTRLENINGGLVETEIENNINTIDEMQKYMKDNSDKSINDKGFQKFLKDAKIVLSSSLNIIRDYSDGFIKYYPAAKPILDNDYLGTKKNDDDVKQDVISKTQRLESVTTVWGNYFKGMYKGRGFLYWILLGCLVDISGFIFFDIALAKRD